MRRVMTTGILAAAALAATGCLDKQTTHTIHLSPEGTVTWVVIEREVRSDEREAGARVREEQEYLTAARAGLNPIAEAFGLLGPASVRTQVYRDKRPFLVLTEARFDRIDWLGRRVLDRLGLPGESRLEPVPGGLRWTLVAAPGPAQGETPEESDPLLALVEDEPAYRVVLESGRFVDAVGFRLEDEGTGASLAATEDSQDAPIVLSLTWTRGGW